MARRFETRSAPALTRCYPCSFTFYLGNPFPRFLRSYWKEGPRSLNVGTMKLEQEDILARLRAGLPALKRQFPLHGLSLFGSVIINSQLSTFFLVAAATWFESMAVASRPLHRRPRRNDLLFHHEEHEAHRDILDQEKINRGNGQKV